MKNREQQKRVLSGMRPTGELHVGNYFGAIRQFLNLQTEGYECLFFVADLHSLTEVTAPTDIDRLSVEVAKNYIACGINPVRSVLYRQSDVPEVSQLGILLGNIAHLGKLRMCTTFKDTIERRKKDEGSVSIGLLGYPVLMAADILAGRGEKIPVGQDQVQHVEMARDFASRFNHLFEEEVFTMPSVSELELVRVPGIDGMAKMGKSDGNTIALLEDLGAMRKKVMRIPTETRPHRIVTEEEAGTDKTILGRTLAAMEPGTRALYQIVRLCSPPEVFQDFCQQYRDGDERFFGPMKTRLADDLEAMLTPIQNRYHTLHDDDVRGYLHQGAQRVRIVAADVLARAQQAMGLSQKRSKNET